MGVGQYLVANGSVEGTAFGVDNARVGLERGLLGAARVVNAVSGGEGVDVVVVEIEVALQLAELSGVRDSGKRIFASDFGEGEGSVNELADAVGREVAGVGAGSALSEEDADPDSLGSG